MIISEKVIVKNSKYYRDLGYNNDKFIEVLIKDLSKGMKVRVLVECDYCKVIKSVIYKQYFNSTQLIEKYACSKCIYKKTSENNLKKYGYECNFKSPDFHNVVKKTNLEKYGVENVFQSDIIKDKIIKSNIKKYGVKHNMELDFIKNKIKDTNLKRYGTIYTFQSEIVKDKIKKTLLSKYGVDHPMKSNIIKRYIVETNLKKYGIENTLAYHSKSEEHHSNTIIGKDINYIKYLNNGISLFSCEKGHTFEINCDNYHTRLKNVLPLCTVCYPIGDQKSIKEKELLEYIKFVYSGEIISSYRDGLEIDIYLPELNLGFEFNGLYWHSSKFKDKNYHLNKSEHFKEKGIRIIHIWEDDWSLRSEIIKSQIKNLLVLNTQKIFARKCIIKEVEIKESKQFLDDNHIQGSVSSTIKIGLYFEDELLSLMTFNSSEGRKKMELGGWNLNRFCNKQGVNVVGGASKLLSYFIKNYEVNRIVSYADKDWSIGNLYEILGFTHIGGNGPDYKYIVDNQRVHKSRYKKDKLNLDDKTKTTECQEMSKRGIYKIYDCGKLKFEKNILYIN